MSVAGLLPTTTTPPTATTAAIASSTSMKLSTIAPTTIVVVPMEATLPPARGKALPSSMAATTQIQTRVEAGFVHVVAIATSHLEATIVVCRHRPTFFDRLYV